MNYIDKLSKDIETFEELEKSAKEQAYAFFKWFQHHPDSPRIVKEYIDSATKEKTVLQKLRKNMDGKNGIY